LLDLYYLEIVFTRAFDLTIIDRLAIRAKRNRLHSFEKIWAWCRALKFIRIL